MGISSYVDWPPACPLQEELIYLESDLKDRTTELKTAISCRRKIVEIYKKDYPELETDMFIKDIRFMLKERKRLKKQLFLFQLKHGEVFF